MAEASGVRYEADQSANQLDRLYQKVTNALDDLLHAVPPDYEYNENKISVTLWLWIGN
jgi:hypothetical protein